MKILFIIPILLFAYSCTNNALTYNDALVTEQHAVVNEINEFMNFIEHKKLDSTTKKEQYLEKLDSLKNQVTSQINRSKNNLTNIGKYKENNLFNNSLKTLFEHYKTGIENSYYQLGVYIILPDSLQSPKKHLEIVKNAYNTDSIINVAELAFIKAQEEFSKQNGINISNQ